MVLRLYSLAVLLLLLSPSLFGQTGVATGSIVGTITDASRAVIIAAQITVTNSATGQEVHVTTNSAGTHNSGALLPGLYTLHTSANGFATVSLRVAVLIGNTASGDATLPARAGEEVIDVTSSELQVNTQQAMVHLLQTVATSPYISGNSAPTCG